MTDTDDWIWTPALHAAVAGAAAVGLLEALVEEEEEEDEESAEGWARRLELDGLVTRRVLDVLALGGIVERRDGRYAASPALRSYQASPGGVAGQVRVWGSVVDALRSGERHADYGPVADRDRTYAGVVDDLARLNEPAARQLAGRLGPADRVLDVGAGAAVWSLAMARHHPGTTVTVLDLPEVVRVAARRAHRLGVDDVRTLPGDFHTVSLPEAAFDRVVVANVLRIEPPDAAARLLARLAPALAPGGELVIVDVLEEPSAEGARKRTAYALHLSLRTASGAPHPRPEVEAWCVQAGLEVRSAFRLPEGPLDETVLVASPR